MIKPEMITSSKYEFECEINPLGLTEDQITELGLDPGNPLDLEVNLKAGGEFVVTWTNDRPKVHVESFVVEGGIVPNKIIITALGDIPGRYFLILEDTQVDFDYLAEKLNKFGDKDYWYNERLTELADAACDAYEGE